MTRSTGTCGLMRAGSPPSCTIGIAHGGEIDDGRDAGEILHQDAGRPEGNLAGALARRQPCRHRADVVGGDRAVILEPQQVLQQHLQREGKLRDAGEAVLLGLDQAVIVVGLATNLEVRRRFEAVERRGHGGQPDFLGSGRGAAIRHNAARPPRPSWQRPHRQRPWSRAATAPVWKGFYIREPCGPQGMPSWTRVADRPKLQVSASDGQ